MKNSPIFIIGSQRSGTTMLRLILNANSKISIPEDGGFLMPLLSQKYLGKEITGETLKSLIKYLTLNPHFKLWNCDYSEYLNRLSEKNKIMLDELINDIYTIYCNNEGKKIWGDKTPSFFRKIKILRKLFPNAKFVHIVRDGRDTFYSLMKMHDSYDNVTVGALEWAYKVFKAEKSLKSVPAGNHVTIRYEDILDDPEKTIRRICSILEVEFEQSMVEFYKTSSNYIGDHHSGLIFKAIDKDNKYKWKKNYSADELSSFNLIAKHYLMKYNYEVESKKINYLFFLKDLLIGIPKRVFSIIRVKMSYDKAVRNGLPVDFLPVGKVPKGYRKDKN